MACSPQVVDTLNIHHLWSYVKVKAYKFMKVCKWVRILYAGKIGRDYTSSKWQLDSYPFNHLQHTSSLVKQIDLHNLHRMIKIRKGGPVTVLSISSPQANWSKSIGHGTVQLVNQNLKFNNERLAFLFDNFIFRKKPSRNFKVCFHAVPIQYHLYFARRPMWWNWRRRKNLLRPSDSIPFLLACRGWFL